jgi:hypothetical protein
MLKIAAHRGYWKTRDEGNTLKAFERALSFGFGIETDVRDWLGSPVIAHDPPQEAPSLSFEEFLRSWAQTPPAGPMAINIKSCGLSAELHRLLQKANPAEYFCFDYAIPDLILAARSGLTVFARLSEYETLIPSSVQSLIAGVWVDAFHSEWIDSSQIRGLLADNQRVCVVSPELHGRKHLPFWEKLRDARLQESSQFSLCTDFPEEARSFFS